MRKTIDIEHLTKKIKDKTVLSDINVTMEQGSIHGLYGHNGSGKTMLLRAISGLIRPTGGSVSVFGQVIGKDTSFPDSMGLIIENVGFWPYYTGMENLRVLTAIKKQIGEKEIRGAILRVGLDPDDKRPYRKYSLGMKQRLGIAQAVMEQPELILLDEPTNALDDDGIKLVHTILREEKERGATILLASHNKDDLRLLCDRQFHMNGGRLQEGEAAQ